MEAMDSIVGRYGGTSDEEPLFHSPRSRRKRSRVLNSDTECDDDEPSPVRSPVRRKKKNGTSAIHAAAIRRKFHSSMSAIGIERESANGDGGENGGQGGDEIGREHTNEEGSGDQIALLMQEVKAGNKMLVELTNRVKKNEKRLKEVENRIKNNSESCSSAGSTPKQSRKRDVPDEVRVCS
jgi:hypothetical protein